MKRLTDFDQMLGPILDSLRPSQQLRLLVLFQQLESPVGRRWLERKIRATGYIRDPETEPWN
jgi:hypothetical protein